MQNLEDVYVGPYKVELCPGVDTGFVPRVDGVFVYKSVVSVSVGTVQVAMGSIKFYANNSPFSLGFGLVKRIYDGKNEIIWENKG